jgi:hypothetical protein
VKTFQEVDTCRSRVNSYLIEEVQQRTNILVKENRENILKQAEDSTLIMVKDPVTAELVPVNCEKYIQKLIRQEKKYLALAAQA